MTKVKMWRSTYGKPVLNRDKYLTVLYNVVVLKCNLITPGYYQGICTCDFAF